MAHKEQLGFVKLVRQLHPTLFFGRRVLEIGSRYINGTVRHLWPDEVDYVGLDPMDGPGVNVVSVAHMYKPEKKFDVVVCCEVLEHDPFYLKTLDSILSFVKPYGLIILTWATPSRAEHGTKRSDGQVYTPEDENYYYAPTMDEVQAYVGKETRTMIKDENTERQDYYLLLQKAP